MINRTDTTFLGSWLIAHSMVNRFERAVLLWLCGFREDNEQLMITRVGNVRKVQAKPHRSGGVRQCTTRVPRSRLLMIVSTQPSFHIANGIKRRHLADGSSEAGPHSILFFLLHSHCIMRLLLYAILILSCTALSMPSKPRTSHDGLAIAVWPFNRNQKFYSSNDFLEASTRSGGTAATIFISATIFITSNGIRNASASASAPPLGYSFLP